MDVLHAIKGVTESRDEVPKRTQYQPVHMGARDWAQPGPVFVTRADARAWLDRQLQFSHRRDDWGYVNEITDADPAET